MAGFSARNPSGGHGGGVRGDMAPRRSPLFEGRFGRMFRDLHPSVWPHGALMDLGLRMTARPETITLGPGGVELPSAAPETTDPPDPNNRVQDPEENSGIPAGYTYFGQFVDHDLTFDPASTLQQQNDPEGLVDYRTPRLDLDSVYGRGPAEQPYMYWTEQHVKSDLFRLGRHLDQGTSPGSATPTPSSRRDLPRYIDPDSPTPVRAIIGDKRNDENIIVGQLHASLMQFHNRLALTFPEESFEQIQRRVRWHYQWLVVNDFLTRICGDDVVDRILPGRTKVLPASEQEPRLHFFADRRAPYIPIEFSVAAYRFGHSMVRPIYRLNTVLHGGKDTDATVDEVEQGIAGRFFVFAGVHDRGLDGFDTYPVSRAIDWSLYFDGVVDNQIQGGATRTQPSYKLDTSLVNPLGFLPEFSTVDAGNDDLSVAAMQAPPVDPVGNPANLAQRNLLRGMALELPSGQAVAQAMGATVLTDAEIRIGKAIVGDPNEQTVSIVDIDSSFAGRCPLWVYVLAEAHHHWLATRPDGISDHDQNLRTVRLGPVGGRIVAETVIGLLAADGSSYLRQAPNWAPQINDARIDTVGALLRWVG